MIKLLLVANLVFTLAAANKPLEDNTSHRAHMLKTYKLESGPVSRQVWDNRPFLFFLGNVNGKHIYYEMTPRTQSVSRSECHGMGMKLLKIDTVAEMEFINARTEGYDFIWIDGIVRNAQSSFIWNVDSTSVNVSDASFTANEVGLTLEKNPTRLNDWIVKSERHYLCYI